MLGLGVVGEVLVGDKVLKVGDMVDMVGDTVGKIVGLEAGRLVGFWLLLPDLPMAGLLLPALPMPAISAPSIPPKENERERSADMDISSTRARTRLPSMRPRKIPWALTGSVAIPAKRKKLDTCIVVWMVLLMRWKSDNLSGRYYFMIHRLAQRSRKEV